MNFMSCFFLKLYLTLYTNYKTFPTSGAGDDSRFCASLPNKISNEWYKANQRSRIQTSKKCTLAPYQITNL